MKHIRAASRSASWTSLAGAVGALLLPKCPLCFAAYGSALGALGVSPGAHEGLVDVLLVLAVTVSFGLVLALSLRRRDAVTPAVSAAGGVLVLGGRMVLDALPVTVVGAVLLVAAAVVNAVRCRPAAALS
jgi:hypothetical protein